MPVSSLEIATTAHIVFRDERQDGFELFLLARHRIDERPALGGFEPDLERRR